MACSFSVAEKEFLHTVHKRQHIFIGTVSLFPDLHVYLQKAEFVTHRVL